MDQPYPTYQAIYNSGNPNQAAANVLNTPGSEMFSSPYTVPPRASGCYPSQPVEQDIPIPDFLPMPDHMEQAVGDTAPMPNMSNMPAANAPPFGTTMGGAVPASPMPQNTASYAPMSPAGLSYLNGFMRTQIGRNVLIEFFLGTGTIMERMGTLLAVGSNYILIGDSEDNNLVACNFDSIKFIKFYY